MVYYLRSIYEDGSTRLGTWGNDVFRGKSLKRKLTNFKKIYDGRKAMDGSKIIGVQVEYCQSSYSDAGRTEEILWQQKM